MKKLALLIITLSLSFSAFSQARNEKNEIHARKPFHFYDEAEFLDSIRTPYGVFDSRDLGRLVYLYLVDSLGGSTPTFEETLNQLNILQSKQEIIAYDTLDIISYGRMKLAATELNLQSFGSPITLESLSNPTVQVKDHLEVFGQVIPYNIRIATLADPTDTMVALFLPGGLMSSKKLSAIGTGSGGGSSQNLSISGSNLSISGGNTVALPSGGSSPTAGNGINVSGSTVTLDTSIAATLYDLTQINTDDADSDPSNELQNAADVPFVPFDDMISDNVQDAFSEIYDLLGNGFNTALLGYYTRPILDDKLITQEVIIMSGNMTYDNSHAGKKIINRTNNVYNYTMAAGGSMPINTQNITFLNEGTGNILYQANQTNTKIFNDSAITTYLVNTVAFLHRKGTESYFLSGGVPVASGSNTPTPTLNQVLTSGNTTAQGINEDGDTTKISGMNLFSDNTATYNMWIGLDAGKGSAFGSSYGYGVNLGVGLNAGRDFLGSTSTLVGHSAGRNSKTYGGTYSANPVLDSNGTVSAFGLYAGSDINAINHSTFSGNNTGVNNEQVFRSVAIGESAMSNSLQMVAPSDSIGRIKRNYLRSIAIGSHAMAIARGDHINSTAIGFESAIYAKSIGVVGIGPHTLFRNHNIGGGRFENAIQIGDYTNVLGGTSPYNANFPSYAKNFIMIGSRLQYPGENKIAFPTNWEIKGATLSITQLLQEAGSNGQVIKLIAGVPTWATDNTGGAGGTNFLAGFGLELPDSITNVDTTIIGTRFYIDDRIDFAIARGNHTGTQLASTISDFAATVTANASVTANTAKITNATHTGDVTGTTALTIAANAVTTTKINNAAVTLPKLATQATKTLIANNGGTTASPTAITYTTLKSEMVLNLVTNTADADKPVSTAQATALAGKEPTISSGTTLQYWRGDKSWQTLPVVSGSEAAFDGWDKNQSDDVTIEDGGPSPTTTYSGDKIDTDIATVKTMLEDTLAFYNLKASDIVVSSSRNIAATDIGNTLICTATSTLTITVGFSAMNIGDEINLISEAATFTIQAGSSVTINGVEVGSKDVGDGTVYTGSILKKRATNEYIVL